MKYIVLATMSLWIVACSAHDENYYLSNPLTLQQALNKCPGQQGQLSCDQLKILALRVNEFAYQLRMDPQNFGKQILGLQETLAMNNDNFERNPTQSNLKAEINKNKQELKERLAVVKWLESPGG